MEHKYTKNIINTRKNMQKNFCYIFYLVFSTNTTILKRITLNMQNESAMYLSLTKQMYKNIKYVRKTYFS